MSLLHRATFYQSASMVSQLPAPRGPEVCFVGRSNAGKSSAINVLTNQKRLAYSSKTPGRTRLINMFGIPDPLDPEHPLGYLVDLPGYGYASVALAAQQEWGRELGNYLVQRPSLAGVVLLIDIRRGITKQDYGLVEWIAQAKRPVLILLTKADKLPYGQRQKAIATIRKEVATQLGDVETIAFSATNRIGLEEATVKILNWISPQVVP
ncbi:ribosome biogenesis GTP-binding protein YihA/YsxC [Oligella urethralis]|uniref:ribosome biogenesis GTP-binding protein YihA/YsxC n=1 Tax=Oligella urethralis TaxID=90245 RepID=UPI002431EC84|nr:ribosome biogenesis GTP-binding protein YihA/YsxC [Oligella urethralis]